GLVLEHLHAVARLHLQPIEVLLQLRERRVGRVGPLMELPVHPAVHLPGARGATADTGGAHRSSIKLHEMFEELTTSRTPPPSVRCTPSYVMLSRRISLTSPRPFR